MVQNTAPPMARLGQLGATRFYARGEVPRTVGSFETFSCRPRYFKHQRTPNEKSGMQKIYVTALVYGKADERTGMQEVEPWIGGLWPALLTASSNGGGAAGSEPEPEAQ
jgi:hypothetical protein